MSSVFVQSVKGKKICLLCTGKSLANHDIDFDQYDLCCGVNRIYKTDFSDKVEILFNNGSINDPPDQVCKNFLYDKKTLKINPNKKIYFVPSADKTDKTNFVLIDEMVVRNDNVRSLSAIRDYLRLVNGYELLTGILAVEILVTQNPSKIDIYGMDFYRDLTASYCQDSEGNILYDYGNSNHDLWQNARHFRNLLKNYKYVKWFHPNEEIKDFILNNNPQKKRRSISKENSLTGDFLDYSRKKQLN